MTTPDRDSYEEGLRDGRLQALEAKAMEHAIRLDGHERRLSAQERITYALLGALAFIQILPVLENLLPRG